jgi:hypothetical protein
VVSSVSRSSVPVFPPARPQQRLAEALVALGMPDDAARAAARIVLDPTDARRRLGTPVVHRTATARIYTVPVQVTPVGTSSFPANKRATPVVRQLPIDGRPLVRPVLPEPTSLGTLPELRLKAASPEHLTTVLEDVEKFLREDNDLSDRIGLEGILRPVLLIALRVEFENGADPITVMVTVDGSSRISSAHGLLDVSPAEVMYRFSDDRYLRRRLGEWRAAAEGAADDDEVVRIARVLGVPAEIIIAVEPVIEGATIDTASEVRSLVGLLHVEPAKKWSDPGILDAQGEEVLDELLAADKITEPEYEVMLGIATMADAAAAGFAHYHDERAAKILKVFVDYKEAVRIAIVRVTHLAQVKRDRRAKVAAELAIRSFRGRETAKRVGRARVGLQIALAIEELWERPWDATDRSPDVLRDAALAELDAGTTFGPAALELGVKGAYELARMVVLAQINLTRDLDPELYKLLQSPATIFRDLLGKPHGIRILAEAVKAGRRGMVLYVIDEDGNPVAGSDGRQLEMKDAWLRKTFGTGELPPMPRAAIDTPEAELREAQERLAASANAVYAQALQLREIRDDSNVRMIESLGWHPAQATRVATRLEEVAGRARAYAITYEQAHPEQTLEDLLPEAADESTEVTA